MDSLRIIQYINTFRPDFHTLHNEILTYVAIEASVAQRFISMAAAKKNAYAVIYFDSPGRAEASRLALSAAGVEFNDVRLTSEEWQKMKPNTPQGQLPMLEKTLPSGVKIQIPQSGAMIRCIARENDLYGTNESERTMVDVVLCTLEDLFSEVLKLYMAREDQVKSAEIKEKLEKETIPKFVKIFEEMKKVNSKEKWLVGSKITVADIALFSFFKQLPLMFGESLAKVYNDNTTLKTHANVVQENPGIKKWIEAHPPKKNN